MSFIDATLGLLSYSPFIGGASPLRSTPGTGHVPVGRQAEIIDGQYYPDRPLPQNYRLLENPYASSVPIFEDLQQNHSPTRGTFGAVAALYANQSKFTAAMVAGRDAESGIDIRV
ncbi:hypothetical protein [Terasakiella sp. SH-1]|uniref:hypothetical protein n=1 Tax=Terasakiella sp. SH-1 TaxID=2560057 RepID=UPI0010740736|nr:hypothetical protein [Terasakiella sp. SH-1]